MGRRHYTLHFDSIKVCPGHSLSADRAIGQGRVRHGLVLFDGLSEETCVRSRAETRASIAQNLEGGNEGARDRNSDRTSSQSRIAQSRYDSERAGLP
jgi:hypothetical protein